MVTPSLICVSDFPFLTISGGVKHRAMDASERLSPVVTHRSGHERRPLPQMTSEGWK